MKDISTPYRQQYDLYRNEYYPEPVSVAPVTTAQQISAKAKAKPGKLRRHIWALCYGTALAAYTTFTLLNVFVIPHDTVKIDQSAMAEIYRTDSSSNVSASGTVSDTGNSTIISSDSSSINTGSGDTGNTPTSGSTAGTVTATETGYQYKDDSMTITLTQSYVNDTMVYIADIQLSSIATLKSGLAEDSFGRNVKEKTSEIADRVGAILAVNGDYYGFRDTGYVIRNGILYRGTMSSQTAQDLVIYEDGSMKIIREGDVTAEELLDEGALQVYSFGPGLIIDGEITVTADSEVAQSMNSNPRTAIGYISPLHYVMVVSDGRTTESVGLSLLQLAEIMDQLGCEQAYNLDGGGSTTMYFNGEVINNPTSNGRKSKERSVSDIVYIGY